MNPIIPPESSLEVTGSDSCTGVSAPIFFNPNEEFGQENIFVSYPNPVSSDDLSIQVLDALHDGKPFEVEIYDTFGGLKLSFRSESPTGYDRFDMSSLPGGMYQVKVILHSNWRTETHLFLNLN